MALKALLAIVLAVLVGCSSGGGHHQSTPPPSSSGWYFGPIVHGKNYTEGMPARPTPQGAGWTFTFPANGQVDAVVNGNPPSMVGATAITLHYAVTGDGFLASEESGVPGRVGICIQRRGDDWSGSGKYQQYRLYGQDRPLLVAGEGQVIASTWTDVRGQVASPEAVDAVLSDLGSVQVVFGGSFASHGVYATQPSTFTMTSIEIVR